MCNTLEITLVPLLSDIRYKARERDGEYDRITNVNAIDYLYGLSFAVNLINQWLCIALNLRRRNKVDLLFRVCYVPMGWLRMFVTIIYIMVVRWLRELRIPKRRGIRYLAHVEINEYANTPPIIVLKYTIGMTTGLKVSFYLVCQSD